MVAAEEKSPVAMEQKENQQLQQRGEEKEIEEKHSADTELEEQEQQPRETEETEDEDEETEGTQIFSRLPVEKVTLGGFIDPQMSLTRIVTVPLTWAWVRRNLNSGCFSTNGSNPKLC
jgi:hypothetical protein